MRALAFLSAVAVALALAGDAFGCVRVRESMSQRLDDSDAAVVGHITSRRETEVRGAPVVLLTLDVEQRVKGRGLGDPIVVRSPLHTDCDVTLAVGKTRGFLLTKAPDGTLLATASSVVAATPLLAAGGEPRWRHDQGRGRLRHPRARRALGAPTPPARDPAGASRRSAAVTSSYSAA